MRTFSGKRSTLALAIAGVTAMSGFMAMPEARAEGFIDDSTLTGGIYYWQRERDRKDVTDGDKYKTNLSHSTWNANLDFQSGYAADMFGLDIAAFTAIEMAENGDSSHPNEIAFSKSNKAYDEDWSGDKSGISLYKAAAKFKYGPVWARAGYIQPTGQTLLAPHWSFMPGTYQGAEAGANFDYGDAGALSFSYMWTNEYKAPWHLEMDEFYQNDNTFTHGMLNPLPGRAIRMRTTTKTGLLKSLPTAWMRCTSFRTVAPKARCSNCTSPNTTTTPTSQAGAAVTATSSRMSAT